MNLNKIYICGHSHGGKGLLTELIDRHNNIIAVPLHNFGLSHLYKQFINHVKSGQYANKMYLEDPEITLEYMVKIGAPDDTVYYDPIGDILHFLISKNACFRFIFQAHFSKQTFIHTVSSQLKLDLSFESYL